MILLGTEIKKRLGKDIIIKPYNEKQLNPNSYNITLNEKLLVYKINKNNPDEILDMKKNNPTEEILIPEEGYILQPGVLYLGRTNEYTETHNLIPVLDGRSSIGRLGLFIHVTAGYGDNHFCGYWTLEITTIHPIKVYPNVSIGQLRYHTMMGEDTQYVGKYQNNKDVQSSMLYKDFENNGGFFITDTENKHKFEPGPIKKILIAPNKGLETLSMIATEMDHPNKNNNNYNLEEFKNNMFPTTEEIEKARQQLFNKYIPADKSLFDPIIKTESVNIATIPVNTEVPDDMIDNGIIDDLNRDKINIKAPTIPINTTIPEELIRE